MQLLEKILVFAVLLLITTVIEAQVSYGGSPTFLGEKEGSNVTFVDLSEDYNNFIGLRNPDFLSPVLDLEINLKSQGEWKKKGNTYVKILNLKLSAAKGFVVTFKKFKLASNQILFAYDESRTQILGGFTSENNRDHSRFLIGPISGNELTLELMALDTLEKFDLLIDKVYVIDNRLSLENSLPYQIKSTPIDTGFNSSLDCHNNISCAQGLPYQNQKRGVTKVMMILEEGLGFCSGSLISNTSENGEPYFLSAFHCQDTYTPIYDLWKFDFNYESATCDNPSVNPSFNSLVGCSLVAGNPLSDFLLLKINDRIPSSFNAFLNGWNSEDTTFAQSGALIHHPNGDLKKISIEHEAVISHPERIDWNNGTITPEDSHFKAILDEGIMEGGSSGAPFFDEDGLIVGQLHGGIPICDDRVSFYGRLSRSWSLSEERESNLGFWLDPINTGQMTLEGMEANTNRSYSINGVVLTPLGVPVPNVTIGITGDSIFSVLSNGLGAFSLSDLNSEGSYSMQFDRNFDFLNGVSSLDLAIIQKHILKIEVLQETWQIKASDVNASGTVSASDLILIRKMILGLISNFTSVKSWSFNPILLEIDQSMSDQILQIVAYKMGDANGTADPTK